MKLYLALSVMFLVMINIALGAVGDVGVSDTDTNSYVPYESGPSDQASLSQASLGQPSLSNPALPSVPTGNPDTQSNYPVLGMPLQGQGAAYPAPQIGGPMQEQLTAEELGLSLPQMENFAPDASLGFVSASQPVSTAQLASAPVQSSVPSSVQSSVPSQVQAALPGSSIWYYPSSVISANRLFVQTASGFKTVAGCSFRGYLPLWADIKSSGNFFVYEWYPGQSTPSVRWWGWTGTGWKKGWFCGDVPGWHTLCYNSGIWSNYIYIYVYPRAAVASAPSVYPNAAPGMTAASPLLGSPIPPDPGSERLILPDFNQYRPVTDQSQSGYNYLDAASLPGQVGSSRMTCPTCSGSTPIAGGVSSSYPYAKSCPTCAPSPSMTAPYGYEAQSYQAVFPLPSVCRCNEYYVQSCPGRLATVAGVFCGEWLPLWSKASRPGTYWSFEWTACSGPSYYCPPEAKNFGYKNPGWYLTWFKGNNPGWHILSYHCGDWSNYIYVYVWPAD